MTTIWAGLSIGAIYALVAIAYNIVFLPTGTFNFAQAQFLMLGTFVAYAGLVMWHLPALVVLAGAVLLGGLVGSFEEVVAIRPLQSLGVHGELVTTVGFAVLLEGIAVLVWGNQPLAVPFVGSDHAVTVLSGRVLPVELVLIVLACAAAAGAELVSRRTTLGLTSLAAAEDRVAATVRGIDVRALSIGAFAAAGALSMGLGLFVAPKAFASFDLGDGIALKAFVALALGGFGSYAGALLGGVVTGLVEAGTARYISVTYADIAVFALLLVVLTIRPTGLFGARAERVV